MCDLRCTKIGRKIEGTQFIDFLELKIMFRICFWLTMQLEKEKPHKKIIELEKELDAKQAL